MKTLIFASILSCFALNVRAQQTQQADSTPIISPWVRANTPSHSGVGIALMSPDTCWGASADSGLLISTDGGQNWRVQPGEPFNGSEWFRTKREGWLLSGPSDRLISKTTDAGITWQTQADPIQAYYVAFVDSLHIYTSGSGYIARTSDGGKTWSWMPSAASGPIAFANSLVGYSVGGEIQGPLPSQIGLGCVKTTDGGNTWNQIYTGIPGGASGVAVINPLTVEVVGINDTASLIYRTTDGGVTWLKISHPDTNHPPAGFEGISIKGAIGYAVGAPAFILRSMDTGKTWIQEPSGLTNQYLYTPVIYKDSLAAAADDAGIIIIRNPSLARVSPIPIDSLSIVVFPNPAQSLVTLSYSLGSSQSVTLTIYDLNGHAIAIPLNGAVQPSGNQSTPIPTTGYANGTYFYRFSSQNYLSTGSFIVTQ